MIIDKTEKLLFYDKMLPNLKNGLEKLKEINQDVEGRHEFEGGFLMIQKGETKHLNEGTFEAHRKYIDVQIVLEGSEVISWANLAELTTAIEYDGEKDAERLDGERKHNILIDKGMFYAMFPEDGHKALGHLEEKYTYTKCVMKLAIN